MFERRRVIGLALAGFIAIAAMGCNVFGTKLTPGLEACVNVPAAACQETFEGRVNGRAPVELTAYQVTCTRETCTEESGAAEVVLNWADGQTETYSYTWN